MLMAFAVFSQAEEGESEVVLKGLDAMQRSVRATDATLVTELIQVYGDRQQPRDAIALSIHARQRENTQPDTLSHSYSD